MNEPLLQIMMWAKVEIIYEYLGENLSDSQPGERDLWK